MAFRLLPKAERVTNKVEAREALAALTPKPLIAFDTETSGLDLGKDRAILLSLSEGARRWAVWPQMLPYFQDLMEDPSKRLIAHNAKFDMWMLRNIGIDVDRYTAREQARVYDTMVMHALVDDAAPHDLKYLSRQYLDIEMVPFKALYGREMQKRTLAEIFVDPAFEAVNLHYSSLDAYATYKLFLVLQHALVKEKLELNKPGQFPYDNLWEYFTETEVLFTKVLWHMERRGIELDVEKLLERAPELDKQILAIEKWFCHKLRRYDINLKSNPQMCDLFFNKLGHVPLSFTAGGSAQLNATALKLWAKQGCEYSANLLAYRDLTKNLGTYVTGLLNSIHADGRIHTRYGQTGARCLQKGTLVLTERGYIPVEDVSVGTKVLTHAYRSQEVLWAGRTGVFPLIKVTLSNGLQLCTNGEHAYLTQAGDWLPAERLSVGIKVRIHSGPEEWRTVPEWEEFAVSSWGRVQNVQGKLPLKQYLKNKWGHLKVTLHRAGAQARGIDKKDFSVHQIVAKAFLPKTSVELRHVNGVSYDNTVGNLVWGTSAENKKDAVAHGTMLLRNTSRTKLTAVDVVGLRSVPRTRGSDGALAREYGVSRETMRDIRTGKRWKEYAAYHPPELYAEVVSIERLPAEETYGLTVAVDASHITGGVITHNTGRLSSCIAEGTLIEIASRTEGSKDGVPIQDVRPGDMAYAYTDDGELVIRKVLWAGKTGHKKVVRLHWQGPGRQRTDFLDLTPEHRVRLVTGAYIRADELRNGAALVQNQRVTHVEDLAQSVDVYDLEIEDVHNFIAGNVCVHNSDPNLQNQPPYIRDAYRAKPGYRLFARDQQQLEMRILAHVSKDAALCEAIRAGKDVHSATAANMYHVPYEDIMAAKHRDDLGEVLSAADKQLLKYRKGSKTLNFGIMYGMGKGKLAKTLGVTEDEAEDIITRYFAAVPGVAEYFKRVLQEVYINGFSYTELGRRRRLPGIWSLLKGDRKRAERQAKNAPIQGFASEILKVAQNKIFVDPLLVSLDVNMLLQIHDELVFELPEAYADNEQIQERIMELMTMAICEVLGRELLVPLDTSGKGGVTWADCK